MRGALRPVRPVSRSAAAGVGPVPAPATGRRLGRPVRPMVMAWALALAVVGCGGDDDKAPPTGPTPSGGALVAAAPGQLVDYVKSKLAPRAEQRMRYPGMPPAPVLVGPGDAAAVGGAAGPVAATAGSVSGTVVQEAGVDEDDLLKTDGSLVLALERLAIQAKGDAPAVLQLHRRTPAGPLEALARLRLAGDAEMTAHAQGMYHVPDRSLAAVLTQAERFLPWDVCGGDICPALELMTIAPVVSQPQVWLDLANLADPKVPAWQPRVRIDGRLLGSRRIGDLLVLVTQHQPVLPVELVPADAPEAVRADLIRRLGAKDLLPMVRTGTSAPQLLSAETDCYLQTDNGSLGVAITTVAVFDLARGGAQASGRCFVGGSEALYMSTSNLYLATTRTTYDPNAPVARFADQEATDIHKFALKSAAFDYRGSGSVAGHLGWDPQRRSFRLSEHAGDLRVLTHTTQFGWTQPPGQPQPEGVPPSPARLSILRESTEVRRLDLLATLPNERRPQPIGKPHEQVHAVRFAGERGYVVTFLRIDPLYVLDLSNPADPRQLGELQTAGFSDHLFPLDGRWLLGVGHDATPEGRVTGVKVALFDVADPSRPGEAASLTFGTSGSVSALDFDRHGIDLHAVGSTVRVGLPMGLVDGVGGFAARRGLQRITVDRAAGKLEAGAMLMPPVGTTSTFAVQDDRSVQIDDMLHYLADGTLLSQAW